ncbi:hypothetical protein JKP88DRAFT_172282 [Tribonema minus]|uniref:Uncharacterized protein n=1 Tax=Tribonema minus TaxID=303371 RepID=A0A835YH78_9STRA|nr:hypothetical protein JKP88DRAFT_172282 [Tribonema minus]
MSCHLFTCAQDKYGKPSDPSCTVTQHICPTGSYCVAGSTAPEPCPAGTFANTTGVTALNGCTVCLSGYYCESAGLSAPSAQCSAGYYCKRGGTYASTGFTYGGDLCTAGHYCSQGTTDPVQCAAGTYMGHTGASICDPCPAGHYCPSLGVVTPINCSQGSYCPQGTGAVLPACPIGTFGGSMGLAAVADCTQCSAGSYCDNGGLKAPTGLCVAGYYCPLGSMPSDTSNPLTAHICPTGSYCVAGSMAPEPCPAGTFADTTGVTALNGCTVCLSGHYCETAGLSASSAQCSAGHYCKRGVGTYASTGFTYGGDLCTAGHYCSQGTTDPVQCAAGTYMGHTGASACDPCPSGHYCPSLGVVNPSICNQGSYCPQGTGAVLPACPIGSFGGSMGLAAVGDCTQCSAGSYCDVQGLLLPTALCAAGYYCPAGSTASALQLQLLANPLTAHVCPTGSYCVAGSTAPEPCPAGTFADTMGVTALNGCIVCLSGYYCEAAGLSVPSAQCSAGYYCKRGVVSDAPATGVTATYASGAYVSTGFAYGGDLCTAGHYCSQGTTYPVQCAAGTYMGHTGASVCDPCPAGYYCPVLGVVAPVICAQGYFCPEGTGMVLPACPIGTFGGGKGLAEVGECTPCTPGYYCDAQGLSEPAALCAAGYYCPAASMVTNLTSTFCPECDGSCERDTLNAYKTTQLRAAAHQFWLRAQFHLNINCNLNFMQDQYGLPSNATCTLTEHICPAGSYCLEGSTAPALCPVGTFAPSTGTAALNDCTVCLSGRYCETAGLSAPSAQCSAGYYCKRGVVSDAPTTGGHYCLQGTVDPTPCPAGSYKNVTGAATCDPCPAGHYCPDLGVIVPVTCDQGSYCPEGTGAVLPACPIGTFGGGAGLAAEGECTPCTEGYYCDAEGLIEPAGPCCAGYYCPTGSQVNTAAEHYCCVNTSCQSVSVAWSLAVSVLSACMYGKRGTHRKRCACCMLQLPAACTDSRGGGGGGGGGYGACVTIPIYPQAAPPRAPGVMCLHACSQPLQSASNVRQASRYVNAAAAVCERNRLRRAQVGITSCVSARRHLYLGTASCFPRAQP